MTPEAGESLVRQELDPLCEGGNGWACFRLSRLVGWYSTDEEISRRSLVELERGCKVGFAPACFFAARSLFNLRKTPEEYLRALDMMERACDLDSSSPLPCQSAASASFYPRDKTIPSNPARATRLYALACERGIPGDCAFAAHAYEVGRDVRVDVGKARHLYELGCEMDEGDACIGLSEMIMDGLGGPEDPELAASFAKRACDIAYMH